MLDSLSRPHFFPGQLLDYRDFNRLAEQGDKMTGLVTSRLLAGGGILLQALDEFAVAPTEGLTVLVRPGMALLPNGEVLVLAQAQALDLAAYRGTGAQTLLVGVGHKVIAQDLYRDEQDPSIQGFRTQTKQCDLVVATECLPADTLELFRVELKGSHTGLRLPSSGEEWHNGALTGGDEEAVLDLRFRKRIVPLTFAPLGFTELTRLREALYGIEDAHRRLQKIFLMEDAYGCRLYLSQLHAEILSVPYQPLKTAFLVAEFAEKLALFLESIARKCPEDQANFDRNLYLEISTMLGSARVRHAIPRALPFDALGRLSERLESFTRFAEQRFTLLNAVEEALTDLRDRAVGFPEKTTFAGHVFERVDYVSGVDEARVAYQASQTQVRKLQTRYRSGDQVTRTGVFVRDGKISLDFEVPKTDLPVVIWFPQYTRRKGAKLEYRINGKTLLVETVADADSDNQWKNRGLIVQPDALVPQGNRLTIKVDETDLDYGFFEAAVYQPMNDLAGGIR